jgi:methionyl-tRNA formyltransferase
MRGQRLLRVVFLGNDEWSVPPLEAVAASNHDLALVVTRTPRPGRRGGGPVPTPVAEAAWRLGLPLAEVETVKAGPGFELLATAEPEVLAVVAYGEILPKAVLELPTVAPVNLHFSLLPELRGAGPVQWALLEGLTVTGVTTIQMDEGMDTGPILLQAEGAVAEEDDAGSLGRRLAAIGGRLLVDTLDRLASGDLVPTPQDDARATYAPKLGAEDRWLDWSQEAEAIVRRVRALSPDPAASTRFREGVLKVFRAGVLGHAGEDRPSPGTIVLTKDGIAVAAGEGLVVLQEVAPEGRRRMTAAEFVRGFRPREGERLG